MNDNSTYKTFIAPCAEVLSAITPSTTFSAFCFARLVPDDSVAQGRALLRMPDAKPTVEQASTFSELLNSAVRRAQARRKMTPHSRS